MSEIDLRPADDTRACADYRQPFTLTVDAQRWFLDRHLQLPKRCQPCRQARKLARLDQLEDDA